MAVGGGKLKSKMLLGYPDEYMDANTGIACTLYDTLYITLYITCVTPKRQWRVIFSKTILNDEIKYLSTPRENNILSQIAKMLKYRPVNFAPLLSWKSFWIRYFEWLLYVKGFFLDMPQK